MSQTLILKNSITPIILTIVMSIISSCADNKWQHNDGIVWNTTYSIVYDSGRNLHDSIMTTMREVELSLSPFNDSSVISAINCGESAIADNHITTVFNAAVNINRLSNGVFDPTVAPLVNLWGFGFDRDKSTDITDEMIDSVLTSVGIAQCSIENNTIIKKTDATMFNFSAITKGYGCDEVARTLSRNGCRNYMVEIGGEIALAGHNPQGKPWRIQIDAPIENDTSIVHSRLVVVELTDCGIATSGNYRNFRTDNDGRRYGHTISPLTGRPVATSVLSATVVAPDCMTADALATACMAMEPDSAINMIDRIDGASCLLVIAGDGGKWSLRATGILEQ